MSNLFTEKMKGVELALPFSLGDYNFPIFVKYQLCAWRNDQKLLEGNTGQEIK